jgi:hypothetical protein
MSGDHWDSPGWQEAARAYHAERQREPPQKPELPQGVTVEDFYAYAVEHNYIFEPTGQRWPSATINAVLPKIGKLKPSIWLDRNRRVEQMTWAPGEDALIKDRLMVEGGWIEKPGTTVFNLYRPADFKRGNVNAAQRWVDHVHKVYPEDAERIIRWCAHRVQYPGVKINHALVLGGTQQIGKDTLLAPVRHALGYWNCRAIPPAILMGRFNGFLKSLLLQISEARDLGEISRYAFYDHTKDMIASPPEMLWVDEKNTHEYLIPNLCGVVITTNYKTGGIYLPAEDRRHDMCWSNLTPTDFTPGYWDQLWAYYDNGGYADIATMLDNYDLDGFNPKAPPPKTEAFWQVVNSSRAPEFTDLDDALQILGYPDAVTIDRICTVAEPDFAIWLRDRKNRPRIPRRFEDNGYVAVRNPDAANGLWPIAGKKQIPYAKSVLTLRDQIHAVQKLQ